MAQTTKRPLKAKDYIGEDKVLAEKVKGRMVDVKRLEMMGKETDKDTDLDISKDLKPDIRGKEIEELEKEIKESEKDLSDLTPTEVRMLLAMLTSQTDREAYLKSKVSAVTYKKHKAKIIQYKNHYLKREVTRAVSILNLAAPKAVKVLVEQMDNSMPQTIRAAAARTILSMVLREEKQPQDINVNIANFIKDKKEEYESI